MRPDVDEQKRRLMWCGMFLFLIGLLTGLVEPHFANVRMGLAAHLEGVMNGIFLIAMGAIWDEIALVGRLRRIAFWGAITGSAGNWLVTTLAAALGTAALSPITGAGHVAPIWQENLVTTGFAIVGVAMIGVSLLALWGLSREKTSISGDV